MISAPTQRKTTNPFCSFVRSFACSSINKQINLFNSFFCYIFADEIINQPTMKKKRDYEKPSMRVYELRQRTQLLQASKRDYEPMPWP